MNTQQLAVVSLIISAVFFGFLSNERTSILMEIGDCVEEMNTHNLPPQEAWELYANECK
jgi:hypothetical protein